MLSFRQNRCLVIAEIAQAHDGSLDTAHAYIDASADAGADGVKFQTHLADQESTHREPWRKRFSRRHESRFDYWRRMEFSEPQWRGLRDHAKERDLYFLSSPFSMAAVKLLEKIGADALKIASGEVGYGPLLDAAARTGLPVLLSTGMSPWTEIDRAVARLASAEGPTAVMQCTSQYPTPPKKVGLNVLDELRGRYPDSAIGLSDHSGAIFAGLAAVAKGIEVLEVHVVWARQAYSPDREASLTLDELAQLVTGVRAVEAMATKVDKDQAARELQPMRNLFTKSIVARLELPAGTELEKHHLAFKKPGTGLDPSRVGELVGRRLKRSLAADDPVLLSDLSPEAPSLASTTPSSTSPADGDP